MNITPETGRITLTLTTRTIKALRLLALLRGETQNDVAENLFLLGGLHDMVDSEWKAGKLKTTSSYQSQILSQASAFAAPGHVHQVSHAPQNALDKEDEEPIEY